MIDTLSDLLTPELLIGVALFAGLIVLVAAFYPQKNKRMKSRLQGLRGVEVQSEGAAALQNARIKVGVVGDWLATSPLIGAKEQAKMAMFLSAAGYARRAHVSVYIVLKTAALVLMPVILGGLLEYLGDFPTTLYYQVVAIAVFAGIGWYLPGMFVGNIAKKRRRELEYGIADALDLLVICVEAGLGLEQALDRVSRDIATANPVVSEELSKTVAEMRVLPQMRDALDNFAKRSNLPAIRSVMTTLVQAVQYGTPLSNSLRVLASEMRKHRMMKIEERAARLPVLMTIPLILFILPCLFIIVGGPAVLNSMQTLSGN